jgi:hypothetical protein
MSVASVAQILQNQNQGGGDTFNNVVVGISPNVLLSCTNTDILKIANQQCATVSYLDVNYPQLTEEGNYSTETETTDYITANYTDNIDLNTDIVSNATLATYSTETETTDYITANYTNTTNLNTNIVSNATIANYSTETETTDYITANYTNNTDLNTDIVSNATLANYSTETETTDYITANYTTETDTTDYITANYTNNTDLNANIVSNATIADYSTSQEQTNNYLPINNYLQSGTIQTTKITIGSVGGNSQQWQEFPDQTIPNFIGSASSSYVAYLNSSALTNNKNPFVIGCVFSSTSAYNTLVSLEFVNVLPTQVFASPAVITIIAAN